MQVKSLETRELVSRMETISVTGRFIGPFITHKAKRDIKHLVPQNKHQIGV